MDVLIIEFKTFIWLIPKKGKIHTSVYSLSVFQYQLDSISLSYRNVSQFSAAKSRSHYCTNFGSPFFAGHFKFLLFEEPSWLKLSQNGITPGCWMEADRRGSENMWRYSKRCHGHGLERHWGRVFV